MTRSLEAGKIKILIPPLPGSAPRAAPPGGASPVLVRPLVPPLMSTVMAPLRTNMPPPPLWAEPPPGQESPAWPPPAFTVTTPAVQLNEINTALPPAAPAPAASLSGLVWPRHRRRQSSRHRSASRSGPAQCRRLYRQTFFACW